MKMPTTSQLPIFQAANAPIVQYPNLHFIKYMGSKREIIEWVGSEIESTLGRESGTVLDLMAGTGGVGYALAPRHRIISNDIQAYSTVLARALLQTTADVPHADSVWTILVPYFEQNRKTLAKTLKTHLLLEAKFINQLAITWDVVRNYREFQNQYPHAGNFQHSEIFNGLGTKFQRLIASRKENPAGFPYCLFTAYFANAYFGLQQAIDIDSLRYALDCVMPEGTELRSLALSCLMHAASYCTPGPGHFAQFRALNSLPVCEDILRYRGRSVRDYFLKKWDEFRDRFRRPMHDNTCETLDYGDALANYVSDADLVYADPPYSFVHYSRFYHALETLVRYDYPGSEFYGRYRTDRHQSPFCVKVQVKDAFLRIIEPTAANKKKLVLSYSNTGMIDIGDLRTLCEHSFRQVQVKTNSYLHATMGRRGDKTRKVKEALVICQP
ncbi:MAG TPA: DNA adenine methylase [Candidatus Angelobacter sp.]|nr:DNA adenine methylase [Candidatus Angelobacter sp.]